MNTSNLIFINLTSRYDTLVTHNQRYIHTATIGQCNVLNSNITNQIHTVFRANAYTATFAHRSTHTHISSIIVYILSTPTYPPLFISRTKQKSIIY